MTFPIYTDKSHLDWLKKSDLYGAREMAWWLGPLAAPAEDLDLFPTSKWWLQLSVNSSSGGLDTLVWSLWAPGTHIVRLHTCRQNKHRNKLFVLFSFS